ncbi:cytochrome P450 2F2-like [Arapaima gigas]
MFCFSSVGPEETGAPDCHPKNRVVMLGTLLLLLIGFYLIFFLLRSQTSKNFPPGPRPVPAFGNLLHPNLAKPINEL